MSFARPLVHWTGVKQPHRVDREPAHPVAGKPVPEPRTAWTPGLWHRWADQPTVEAHSPTRPVRSSWSLTNHRLRALLHH